MPATFLCETPLNKGETLFFDIELQSCGLSQELSLFLCREVGEFLSGNERMFCREEFIVVDGVGEADDTSEVFKNLTLDKDVSVCSTRLSGSGSSRSGLLS